MTTAQTSREQDHLTAYLSDEQYDVWHLEYKKIFGDGTALQINGECNTEKFHSPGDFHQLIESTQLSLMADNSGQFVINLHNGDQFVFEMDDIHGIGDISYWYDDSLDTIGPDEISRNHFGDDYDKEASDFSPEQRQLIGNDVFKYMMSISGDVVENWGANWWPSKESLVDFFNKMTKVRYESKTASLEVMEFMENAWRGCLYQSFDAILFDERADDETISYITNVMK